MEKYLYGMFRKTGKVLKIGRSHLILTTASVSENKGKLMRIKSASIKREKKKTADMNVFISDDSPVVRVRLANMIDDIKGLHIIGEAQNVQESIKKIEELRPDAVILDIRMPGGSGIDVLKRIKQIEKSPIVIVLTNYPYPQYRSICIDAGADYFFDKSNEFHKVVDVFKSLV